MILLERNLTLEEKHRYYTGDGFCTVLEKMTINLWYHFRPCKVTINGEDALASFDPWCDFNLKVGDKIIIRVER